LLISLKPLGCDASVNPKYVTNIESQPLSSGRNLTKLWVVGNSGYGTMSHTLDASVEKATEYLNDKEKEACQWAEQQPST
jgi:hypothetical protein